MSRQVLKYLAVAVVAVMMSMGCEEVKIIEPCEQEGTGILKLINNEPFRLTVKIDGKVYGRIEPRGVEQYVLAKGEYYVCMELNNAICYHSYTIDIIPCEITTK